MNIVANNFASKAAVAFVAAAMIFTTFAPAARAQTQSVEDLQKMIDQLMAQVEALKGGSTGGSSAAGVCPFTWTRDLRTGATGADVKALQQFLNSDADTRVAATGAGSAGMETQTFGPATAAAVSKFQVKYRADILTPGGLVNPTGTFGPMTRAKANALCVAAADDSDEDEDATDEDEEGSEDEDTDLSGEASLSTFEIADGDASDDVEEGSEDIVVGEITVEFEDGDAEISRLDLALEVDSGNNGDDDPWKVFQEVSLWVDGEEVARMDVSDEDEYLDEDDGSLRFSDLGIVAMEDEEVVIEVAVTVNGSVDGVGSSDNEGWNIAAGSLRFFDADGVATTETTFGDLQDITGTLSAPIAEFDIKEAGEGDDLRAKTSSEDPEGTTLEADEDKNVEHLIFAFELSAEDSDGDVELNELTMIATSTVASNMDDLVNDFRVEIDGDSFDAESYTGTGAAATLVFDIDGDVTIPADETVTVKLYADFEDMESGDEGSTIVARVNAVDAEGVESGETITVDGLPKAGDTFTLRTEGIDVDKVADNSDDATIDGSDNDYGEYEVDFEITAFGEDAYIANTGSAAFTYRIEDETGAEVATGTATSSTIFVSEDDAGDDPEVENGYYRVDEGSTETFTFRVIYNPLASGEGEDYRVQFLTVIFNDTADTVSQSTETLSPASSYESKFVQIAD